jgi:cobalt-zinc-cadmium efflux system outer membrane protein
VGDDASAGTLNNRILDGRGTHHRGGGDLPRGEATVDHEVDFGPMRSLGYLITCGFALCRVAGAQQPVTRADAIASALSRGGRLAVARADTAAASAQLITAGAWQNPLLAASYSKSPPQYHLTLEFPFDLPGVRGLRIESAQASRRAAGYRFQFERAAIAVDADTTFTRAQAALAHAALSRRNAADADTLLSMAVARRNAGDAAELDVQLATVNAGQQSNLAIADSLSLVLALEDLRTVMGLPAGTGPLVLVDSLAPPPLADSGIAYPGTPLPVAAAQQALTAAQLALRFERRNVFGSPAILGGIETHDPSGSEPGILPTVGFSIPLPLLNRNRGPIAQAEAERARASAELTLARVETDARIARARRERTAFRARAARDQRLLASANRIASMSLTAYRAGAASLPNVFEAQRNAREVLSQYIDDVAAAWIAESALRLMTLTTGSP